MELAKGLKKGDIFEEAGRYFVVEEVLENGNYISSEIKKPEEKPKRAKKTKAEQSVPEHEENVPEDKENVPDEEEDKEE